MALAGGGSFTAVSLNMHGENEYAGHRSFCRSGSMCVRRVDSVGSLSTVIEGRFGVNAEGEIFGDEPI